MHSTEQQRSSLLLRVNNSNQLESGCEASHLFGPKGGRVGSRASCPWRIQDSRQSIAGGHFDIILRDGVFCLSPLSRPLMINGTPVEENIGFVRLQQGDEISLGLLTLKTFISADGQEIRDPLQVSPESLVTHYSNPLDSLLEKGQPGAYPQGNATLPEPVVAEDGMQDPLRVLQNETLSRPATDLLANGTNCTTSATLPISDNVRDQAMDQDFIELPQISRWESEAMREDMSEHFVAITPLIRGLNAPLSVHDSQQVNDFLEEAGRTLQSAIRGLLALQRQQNALSDRHLRPLEDNPLRLNLDYDTTLNVLFAEGKSPVHLSAPEAVAECLHNLRLHQQANQAAISEALAVMLSAFSPVRLMARFAQYRRSAEREEMDAAWAWNMYCRYYEELTSSRQQGFSKLFNEVYEQAYDRALRQGEAEQPQ